MSLHIFNVRRGFANNSSSSHSMVLMDPARPLRKRSSDDGFGWSNFTLLDGDQKNQYLTSLLGSSLARSLGEQIALDVMKDLKLVAAEAPEWSAPDIDHQSQIILPLNSSQDTPNLDFVRDFVAWAQRSDVAILGGNDNSDGHPDHDKGLAVADWRNWLGHDVVAWKDTSNNTWSLFSKDNGLTLRMSFDDLTQAQYHSPYAYERPSNTPASRPNLVDVKITDRCPFACAYCYQASTPKAPHASLSSIVEIASALSKAEVFEVAIGGGEPTLHPDFEQIIHEFKDRGVVPNFTTRNIKWLQSERSVPTLKKVGGFAVSVDHAQGMKDALAALSVMEQNLSAHHGRVRPSIQVVVGTQSQQEFSDMMDALFSLPWSSRPSLTLLGYKNNGFGAPYRLSAEKEQQIVEATAHWPQWVVDAYQRQENIKQAQAQANGKRHYGSPLWVSIDTALAQQSQDHLDKLPGGDKMFHTEEGTLSMYVDAVRQVMAPSSFAHPDQDRVWNPDTWLEDFRSFSSPAASKKKKLK